MDPDPAIWLQEIDLDTDSSSKKSWDPDSCLLFHETDLYPDKNKTNPQHCVGEMEGYKIYIHL